MSVGHWKTREETWKVVTYLQMEIRRLEWEALFTILEDGVRRLYEQAKEQGSRLEAPRKEDSMQEVWPWMAHTMGTEHQST